VAKPGSGLAPRVTKFSYFQNAFNQLANVTDPRGKITRFTYTGRGEPLTVTRPLDAAGVAPLTTYAYSPYTAAGFPTFYLPTAVTQNIDATRSTVSATTYNAANKYVPATSVTDSGGLNLTTTYTYDAVGNLTGVDGPRTDVADVQTLVYDAERRPIQTTDALGHIAKLYYDADGRLTRNAAQFTTDAGTTAWMVACRSYTNSGKLAKTWGPGQTAAAATCSAPTSRSMHP
jgi:YD repeat-containing protein